MVTNVELPLGTGSFGNFLFLKEYNNNNLKNVSAALQVLENLKLSNCIRHFVNYHGYTLKNTFKII